MYIICYTKALIDFLKDEIKSLSHQFMQQLGSNEQGKMMKNQIKSNE